MKQKITTDDIKNMCYEAYLNDKEICKEKMIAILCCDNGLSRRTIVETVNLVINAGYVKEVKNEQNEVMLIWAGTKKR
jgi:hypothetical protein